MKKPTMIIGKKQIILAGMTLILGLAVYINYAVSTSDGKIKATDVVKSQSVNYGDAQLVSTDSTSDYFAQARIDRMNSRDEAVETLKNRSFSHDRAYGVGEQGRDTRESSRL